ncbi:glutamate-cysteine ligase family protein [Streptococcus dentiloxodontae]
MSRAIQLLKERYLEPIKKEPKLYIGIELEFPVVNLQGEKTDTNLTKALLVYLSDRLGFNIDKCDDNGNPIQIADPVTEDLILFEVSYNTIEFAFGKAEQISEVEERFNNYLKLTQGYLRQFQHELQGWGVNPSWALNDNSGVKSPRYQMLMDYLALSKKKKDSFFHAYPEYGAFICGSQVQLDVSQNNFIRVINAFNKIEPIKALLFANSEFWGSDWNLTISRDVFWENSMHGVFPENAGVFPRDFKNEEDYFSYLSKTAIFTADREGSTYYFEPIRACDYLEYGKIKSWSIDGREAFLAPCEKDFKEHRSYQYQDLTKRGTVEFRSVCTQPFDRTFAPAAFHLGLLVNLSKFEKVLAKTDFFARYDYNYPAMRRLFSEKSLAADQIKPALPVAKELLVCAREGLQLRQKGEEVYLEPLEARLALL